MSAIASILPQDILGYPDWFAAYFSRGYGFGYIGDRTSPILDEAGNETAAEKRAAKKFADSELYGDTISMRRKEVLLTILDTPGATIHSSDDELAELIDKHNKLKYPDYPAELWPLLPTYVDPDSIEEWRELQRHIMFFGLDPDTTPEQLKAHRKQLEVKSKAEELGLDPDHATEEDVKLERLKARLGHSPKLRSAPSDLSTGTDAVYRVAVMRLAAGYSGNSSSPPPNNT